MAVNRSSKNWNLGLLSFVAIVIFVGTVYLSKAISTTNTKAMVEAAGTGFNQFGYNYQARVFNGTGESWSLSKGLPSDYLGVYAKDKLVMKWNAEWDRGNLEGWTDPPYDAWENNEWNGKVTGGSGAVWHYKIVWDKGCAKNNIPSTTGSYCIWGQFATIMDQGTDPNYGPGHLWFAKAKPAGYGAY